MFRITYALYKGDCVYTRVFRESVSLNAEGFNGDELVGRFIGVRLCDGGIEGCIRVSYASQELLESLLNRFRVYKIRYRIVYRGKGNIVLYFSYDKCFCSFCPLIKSTGGVVPKTMLVSPLGLLFEFVVADGVELDSELFEVLLSGSAHEIMDYMLTPREQEVLYYAYSRGYYSTPRRVTLRKLSEELRVKPSTLNEILRSAERKIVTAYMRHDLPHLILRRLLEKLNRSSLKLRVQT